MCRLEEGVLCPFTTRGGLRL